MENMLNESNRIESAILMINTDSRRCISGIASRAGSFDRFCARGIRRWARLDTRNRNGMEVYDLADSRERFYTIDVMADGKMAEGEVFSSISFRRRC